MAKKQKCPEFENHERWLVAFADMMTLLFALFVVLYSIANVEVEKLKKVSSSIQKAFGVPFEESKEEGGLPRGNSRTEGIHSKTRGNTNRDSFLVRHRREMAAIIAADIKALEKDITEKLNASKATVDGGKSKDDERVVFFNRDADGIRVTLLARKFFKPNEVDIDKDARKVLDGVAVAVKSMGRLVRVEGHTDNRPFLKNGMTNWELSAIRASSVTRYFIDRHGYTKDSIYASGFADSKPIAPNDSVENRAMNRRVDLKILYDTPGEYLPPLEKTAPESPTDSSTPPSESGAEN
jgi:chemotaxis protein MotB